MKMTALNTAPQPAVLSYLAPGVRVEKLNGDLRTGYEQGTQLEESIAGDIQKVQVTLENTGCSQYSITLSNWRTDVNPSGSGVTWPRYQFNDFSTFKFGQRLRLSMRYWPDLSRSTSEATRRSHTWVPMISGPITDMQFTFGDRSELTLAGEDDLSRLKDKHDKLVEFTNPAKSELQLVNEILRISGYPFKSPATSRVSFPPFASDSSQGIAESLQEDQSYLDFLNKLADRLDAEVFIAFSDLSSPRPEQIFHFEPSRSRAKYDDPGKEVIILRRDETLIDFNPTIKVADQYTSVQIRGRDRDRSRPVRIAESNTDIARLLEDEIQYVLGDTVPLAGPKVRQKFFPKRDNVKKLPNQPNTDRERASFLADTTMRRKAREFLTIQAHTVGLPRLRPGNYVEIRGLRDPFDGFYYVTKAVHTFDGSGLRTAVTARRPGMPMP